MRQLNERDPALPRPSDVFEGPGRDFTGAYAFARYQLTRRTYFGARVDWLQDPEADGDRFNAASAYFTFFPSEFSKLVAGYERTMPNEVVGPRRNRILLQATFAIGPHRPHPF
jgi:hypothetical protein